MTKAGAFSCAEELWKIRFKTQEVCVYFQFFAAVMDPYKETFDTWNQVAALYQERFMEMNLYDHSYDVFCSLVSTQGAKILEIGCGPGNISRYLLHKRPDFRLFGVDVAPNMIQLARDNCPQATFEVMDCRNISILNEQYHGIIGGFYLPYITPDEAEKMMADAARLLVTQGVLYMSFVEGPPHASGYQTGSSGNRVYFNFHSLEHLLAVSEVAGFRLRRIFKVPYPKNNGEQEEHTILLTIKTHHSLI